MRPVLVAVSSEKPGEIISLSYPPDRPYGSLSQLLRETIGVTSREEAERTYRQKIIEAAKQTTGEVLPTHRLKEVDKLSISSQQHRAQQNGIGIVTQKKLDRLARERSDLHEEVKAGRLSVHRASIQAGFIREATPLDRLKRAWTKASQEERDTFLASIFIYIYI